MLSSRIGLVVTFGVLAAASHVGAQQVRSFTTPERRSEQKAAIPRNYLPPKGMCRIWIDSVPPRQQPAPTDCATAIRNKPQNGRVIFSEDKDDSKDRKGKEKPRKPRG